jgi:cytochrome P450
VALTWTLWLLAKDQATQQRVFDEVTHIAGDGSITAAHVDRLIFCRQVISEAMRLIPPAPGIGRQPNDAMTLAGMQIGVRTRVHIPIFALHRNVRLWDNPTAFDPDHSERDNFCNATAACTKSIFPREDVTDY